jgi:hypothetical protein
VAIAHRDFHELVVDKLFSPEDPAVAAKNGVETGWIGQKLANKLLTGLASKPYSFSYRIEPRPWIAKELIFDIDLNDSGDVRGPVCGCGKLKPCCDACWEVRSKRVTEVFVVAERQRIPRCACVLIFIY